MKLTTIEGKLSALERTTQVTGEESATTTHIAIFRLGEERVLLKTKSPAMIAEGDQVKLAGVKSQGQFTAVACRNITTGWTTEFKRQSCAMAALIAFAALGVLMTLIFPLFLFFPLILGALLFGVLVADARLKRAHLMVCDY